MERISWEKGFAFQVVVDDDEGWVYRVDAVRFAWILGHRWSWCCWSFGLVV